MNSTNEHEHKTEKQWNKISKNSFTDYYFLIYLELEHNKRRMRKLEIWNGICILGEYLELRHKEVQKGGKKAGGLRVYHV